jgi:hypothetical protein
MDILVEADWDAEASVFVAQSADVPGLVTEAATAELLAEKLRVMIPELFALNGGAVGPYNIQIAF